VKTLAMSPLMGFEGDTFREFVAHYYEVGYPTVEAFLIVEGNTVVAFDYNRASAYAFAYRRGYALVQVQDAS